MKKVAMLLGVLLALGVAAPALAQDAGRGVVDYGDGIKWDHTPMIPMHPIPGPGDTEYHRTAEEGKHIPKEAPPAAFAPRKGLELQNLGHEFDGKSHPSL